VFNPAHHALFLYWLFFHPSSLKIYLYQIDKELYFKKGLAIFRTLIMPAYLNFYLIALVQAFFLSSIVILLFWSFETLVLQAPVSYFFINDLQTVTPLMNLAVMFKGMAVGVGGSRAIFYPWQWLIRQLNLSSETIIYDELLVLPVSTPYAYFEQQWQKSDSQTLSQLAHIAANPFQRYQAQRILFVYYQQQPFSFIYKVLQQSDLQNCAIFPIRKYRRDKLSRQM